MSVRCSLGAFALTSLATLAFATPTLAQSWRANVAYGGSTPMDMYVPAAPAAPAPVVVSLHYCGGTKGNAQPWFKSYADTHGFIIITPQAGGNCFDAAPSRGGERGDIVAMVEYAVDQHGADPTRVFAAGPSSGACMTHALLAAYPEVFTGGSSLAGVPAGAWTGGNEYGWSSPMRSAQEWGDIVRQGSEGYMGQWPRIQIWQAEGDEILFYPENYPAQVAQWTNVHGVSEGVNEMIQPPGAQDTWDRTSYFNADGELVVEANSVGPQVPHDLSGRGLWGDIVRFFALDQPPGQEPARDEPVGGMDPVDGMGGAGGVPPDGAGGAGGAVVPSNPSAGGGTGGTGGSDPGAGDLGAGATGNEMPVMPTPMQPVTPAPVDQSDTPTPTPATPATSSSPVVGADQTAGAMPPSPSTSSTMMPMGLEAIDSSTGDDGGCRISSTEGRKGSGLALFALGTLAALLTRRRTN